MRDCDWYFADTDSDIERMDTSNLHNVRFFYKTVGKSQQGVCGKRGIISLLFSTKLPPFSHGSRNEVCLLLDLLLPRFPVFPTCKKIHYLDARDGTGRSLRWEGEDETLALYDMCPESSYTAIMRRSFWRRKGSGGKNV